jgi:hypothetical protein
MERGWIETIQLLGLDVMSVVALLMLLLAKLSEVTVSAARFVSARLTSRPGLRTTGAAESTNDSWPPKEWRPSH